MESDWESVEEGVELLQAGEIDAAIEELSRVALAEPENEHAHLFLGNAHFEQEEFDKALKCYVRALEIVPKFIGAMIGAGQCLRYLGDHKRALRMGKEVLLLRKYDPDALFLMGAIHFQRGESAACKAYLTTFLETNPEIEVALEVRGMLESLENEES